MAAGGRTSLPFSNGIRPTHAIILLVSFFFHLTFLKNNYTGDNSTRMTQAVGLHQLSVGNTGPGCCLLQFGLQEIILSGTSAAI